MSKYIPSRRRCLSALACIVASSGVVSSWGATPNIELLEQASVVSPKWQSLAQLDIARVGTKLVSVGERGVIGISEDSAKSWHQVKTPVSCTLTRVYFVDARVGWAIGHSGVILKTIDAGTTWIKQFDGVAAAQAELAAERSAQNDTELSQRRIEDAQRLVSEGPDKPFLAMQFTDSQRGVVVGAYGLAFKTIDGGSTWRSMMGELAAANQRHLYSVLSTDGGMLIAGEQGVMVSSSGEDGAYSLIPLLAKSTIFGMLKTGKSVIAFGLKGAAFRRAGEGSAWTRIDFPPLSITAGIHMSNGSLILGNEAGQLFSSEDDGLTFRSLPVRNPEPISGLVEAADGTIVRVGVRGINRIVLGTNEGRQ
nr:YCF48-related protein [uncultured Rhodoferax sp.]